MSKPWCLTSTLKYSLRCPVLHVLGCGALSLGPVCRRVLGQAIGVGTQRYLETGATTAGGVARGRGPDTGRQVFSEVIFQ